MTTFPPIIVTLRFDPQTTAWLQRLRTQHFPPALNLVPAHLTLFHQLPGSKEVCIRTAVETAAARVCFPITVKRAMKLGRGVALQLESSALDTLRGQLAQAFEVWLTPQDRAPFRPHVTIQNKTTPTLANQLFNELNSTFQPFTATAEGIELWHYLGGPWSSLGMFPFAYTPDSCD